MPTDGLTAVTSKWTSAWGFAEATFFFVVPDVLLTFVALRSLRRAMWASGFAVLGALAGGALMHRWSAADPAAAVAAVESVPFVSAELATRVHDQLAHHGAAAIVAGAWMGRPYKLYAVHAPRAGIGAAELLAVTVPARLLRFVFLAAVAYAVRRFAMRRASWRTTRAIWAAAWLVNYAVYWTLMSR